MVARVENVALYLGVGAAVFIGLLNVTQWVIDFVDSLKRIREGPPEIPIKHRTEPDQADTE